MLSNVLYELSMTTEATVPIQVESSRGAIIWTQKVPVRRLIHQESLRPTRASELTPERIEAMAQGAAAEGFIELLRKTALDAGLQWLLLNLEGSEHVFLFSTRRQEHLAETLGFDAGTVEAGQRRFTILTDRRVPHDCCYGLRARNYRIFARWEQTSAAIRVYLSEFVRVGAGRSAVQASADEAIHYLRAAQWGIRPSSTGEARTSERFATSAKFRRTSDEEPLAFPPDADSRPVSPGILTVAATPSKAFPRGNVLPTHPSPNPLTAFCPLCGGELFYFSKIHAFCRSCDWNNLELLAR